MTKQAVTETGHEPVPPKPVLDASFRLPDGVLSSIIQASPVGMLLVDAEQNILFANPKVTEIFGHSARELAGLAIEDLMPERFRHNHPARAAGYINGATPRSMGMNKDLRGLARDGREIDLEIGLSPVEVEGRQLILASIIDITDRRRVAWLEQDNEALSSAAYRDPLTDLPNRRLFLKKVDELRDRVIRHHARIVVMFMDLDGFKEVNDHYGHAVGDDLLCQVAAELNAHVRDSDIVSRIGGDEFLVCYADVGTGFDAQRAADRLVKAVAAIASVDGHEVSVGASIGVISTGLDSGLSIDEIVTAADRLMYKAKLRGKNRAVVDTYDIYPER